MVSLKNDCDSLAVAELTTTANWLNLTSSGTHHPVNYVQKSFFFFFHFSGWKIPRTMSVKNNKGWNCPEKSYTWDFNGEFRTSAYLLIIFNQYYIIIR